MTEPNPDVSAWAVSPARDNSTSDPAQRRLLTLPEVLRALPIGESRMRLYIKTGVIRSIRVGRRIYVTPDALDEFIARIESGEVDGASLQITSTAARESSRKSVR